MKIIGLTGRIGAGRHEAARYLEQRYGIPALSAGDLARDIAASEDLPPSRDTLLDVSERYRRRYGDDFFMRRLLDRAETPPGGTVAVVGVRTAADVDTLREAAGDDLLLVHVRVTAPTTRFERLRRRGAPHDPQTYDDFVRQDEEEERRFHVEVAIGRADATVDNDGDLDAFHARLDALVAEHALAADTA